MGFSLLLKALRVNSNITRKAAVERLSQEGINWSESSLQRLEEGKSKTLSVIKVLFRLYCSKHKIRHGIIEATIMPEIGLEDRARRSMRFITNNLHRCKDGELTQIETIIRNIEE